MLFIDYAPVKNCKSPMETYGEICIKCNKCGRFNGKCLVCSKVIKPEDEYIFVELYDVFADPVCKGKCKSFIKKHGKWDEKYQKYFIDMNKKEFKKLIKKETK